MQFQDLRLTEPILRAVAEEGYTRATPIQHQAIPHVLAGRDILGCARTGTGKTAAFALPILQRLSSVVCRPTAGRRASNKANRRQKAAIRLPRALILCPTRELGAQIGESFRVYGRHLSVKHITIYGGVNQNPQVAALRRGVDVIIATPGRLLDLMQQGHVDLSAIEVLVLDEADRMLDMGFLPDIQRIGLKLPHHRQTLLFSATMPADIRALAAKMLHDPINVQVDPVSSAVQTIAQSVYHVPKKSKPALLRAVLTGEAAGRTLVFTRTKHGADRVVKDLTKAGIRAAAIHGNKSQNARTRALASFKSNSPPVLVATDIASRGIDVDEITHVINFDIPVDPESYVHRIGRTARAGASGAAISFCDPDERCKLHGIERLTGTRITVRTDQPAHATDGRTLNRELKQPGMPGSMASNGRRARGTSKRNRSTGDSSNGNGASGRNSHHRSGGKRNKRRSDSARASTNRMRRSGRAMNARHASSADRS